MSQFRMSLASIAAKLGSALETHVGQEKSVRINVSYHIFPKTGKSETWWAN